MTRDPNGPAEEDQPRLGRHAAGPAAPSESTSRARRQRSTDRTRPDLGGARVLTPLRDEPDGGPFAAAVRAAGGVVLPIELIRTEPPSDLRLLDGALAALAGGRYGWLALTSSNAITSLAARAQARGTTVARVIGETPVAVVGPRTAAALADHGVQAALMPRSASSARELVLAWPHPWESEDEDAPPTVLHLRGDLAEEALARGLRESGWSVDAVEAYRTVTAPHPAPEIVEAWTSGDVDAVLVLSGSSGRAVLELLGPPPSSSRVVAIGSVTATAARSAGLRIDAVAPLQTPHSLIATLAASLAPSNDPDDLPEPQ